MEKINIKIDHLWELEGPKKNCQCRMVALKCIHCLRCDLKQLLLVIHKFCHSRCRVTGRIKLLMLWFVFGLVLNVSHSLTSYPRSTAMWKDNNCSGMTDKIPWRQSTVLGTSRVRKAWSFTSSSPLLQISMGRPWKKITYKNKIKSFW